MSQHKDGPPISAEMLAGLDPDARRLVCALVEYYEARIAELERRLGMTPQNSSLPPSSQHPHAKPAPPKPKSKQKRGGQKGHRKHRRTLVPPDEVDEIVTLKPPHCRRCGEQLSGDDPQPWQHQVFELPKIKPIITEYQQHKLRCACCGVTTTAALPGGVPRGQSGPRLVAFTALLMAYFRQSKRRTALFVEEILNVPCSTGLTVKHQNITTAALRGCYDELRDALPQADAANLDETATKESHHKAWLWVAATRRFTLFATRPTRSADVVRELLGDDFAGIVTCDRYAGYDHCRRRQLCWAHLKRDFQAMVDSGGAAQRIGRRLLDATHELFRHWHRYRDGTIGRATYRRYIPKLKFRVWEALEDGLRCRHDATSGTCGHLFDRFDHLWTFADQADVEPTNNAAERALRHAVIWRKLSFGTQSTAGSRFVETLLSVIETCRQQGRGVLQFTANAVESHFTDRPTPPLLAGV